MSAEIKPLAPESGVSAGLSNAELAAEAGVEQTVVDTFRAGIPYWKLGRLETQIAVSNATGIPVEQIQAGFRKALAQYTNRGVQRFAGHPTFPSIKS